MKAAASSHTLRRPLSGSEFAAIRHIRSYPYSCGIQFCS